MAYSGVYVFGDSLVDAGNALKLAQWYGGLPFTDLPDGAPTAGEGYYQGRFTNGYNFADLLANAAIGTVTKPIFPYGFEDPWLGVPIAPFASDPNGNNLNFAYGGAQVRQGDEVVQDLDSQTDTFRDALDGDADSHALHIFTMGGNDVRNLAKVGSNPAPEAAAYAALDEVAQQLTHEISQIIDDGARHILITGIPDVGVIPDYDIDNNGTLDAAEQMRADAATLYSQYLDMLIRTEVVPALRAEGATVTYVPLMDYQAGAATITGGFNAILPTMEALHGLALGTLTTDLLTHRNLVFFDDVHPTAQVHALFGAYAQALLTNTPWIETLPLTGADVDYTLTASIAVAGEVDNLVIATVSGTTYRFEMLGMSSLGTAGTLADPALRMLGPSGNVLGANANDGAGFDAMLSFTAAASGNATLELSAAGGLTGSYVFQAAVVGGTAMQAGNTYSVSSAATLVLEGAGGIGTDTVSASVSYALANGSEIEVLRTGSDKGKTAINLTGNDFGQAIIGNSGVNILEGKGGADVMTGGGGKDVFVLSGSAVSSPANIDRITDYERGEIVDISQILSVAAGTNVVASGYVRVTTSGLIQVDLTGGGNDWVTLSNINGNGAVTLRYLSGGAVTNVSVSRVAANNVLTSAVAAAGMMAVPAVAEHRGSNEAAHPGVPEGAGSLGLIADEQSAFAPGGEDPQAAHPPFATGAAVLTGSILRDGWHANAPAITENAAEAPTQLLGGTDAPAHGNAMAAALPAFAVAMPAADMLQSPQDAVATAEVGRIFVDAMGGGRAESIDTLLDGLPGQAHPLNAVAVADVVAVAPGGWEAAVSLAPALLLETMAMHPDAAAAAC